MAPPYRYGAVFWDQATFPSIAKSTRLGVAPATFPLQVTAPLTLWPDTGAEVAIVSFGLARLAEDAVE
ncbi:MAG: hypothetical protein H0X42_02985 [Solirubrobacterales bacterium]|nr:hypothetical protein [Solirubrobacterales bacterium]